MSARDPMSPTAWRVWMGVGVALFLSLLMMFGLVSYAALQGMALVRDRLASTQDFVLMGMALSQAGLLRSLAMLIGTAIACGGLLVSFLTVKETIDVQLGADAPLAAAAGRAALGLKTSSPGVLAVMAGAVVVVAALLSTTDLRLQPPAAPGAAESAAAAAAVAQAEATDRPLSAASLPPAESVKQSLRVSASSPGKPP